MATLNCTFRGVLDSVNEYNGLSLKISDVLFTKPRQQLNIACPPGGKGEMACHIMTRDNKALSGMKAISWIRLSIADVAALFGATVAVPATVATVKDVISYLEYYYGIFLNYADFEDVAPVPAGANRTITFTSKTDAWFTKGTAVITLTPGAVVPAATWVFNSDIYCKVSDKMMAEHYRWPLNVNTQAAVAATLKNGYRDFTALAAMLTTLTGDPWCYKSTPAPFNLMGAIVQAVGGSALGTWAMRNIDKGPWVYSKAFGSWGSARPDYFLNVAVIELGDLCTNLEGNLILHWL